MTLPNYDRIQHASVRAKVDPQYGVFQRALDEAWYGDKDGNGRSDRATGAKAGVRGRMWHGIEITTERQFNRLSGLIEAHRVVALVDQNEADGSPYPDLDKRFDKNPDGSHTEISRKGEQSARIESERQAGMEIDAIVAGLSRA